MTPLAPAALLLAGAAAPVVQTDLPLAGGGRQTHTVDVRAGDALRGIVEQRGIDVVVTVRRPDDTIALEVDSPNGTEGPEPIALVARTAGTYTIEVGALTTSAAAGRYDLRLDAPRAATRADRDVAEALDLHIRAFAARNEALSLMGQALHRRSSARYADAARMGERALRLRQRALGPGHPDVAATHEVLGYVDDEIGDYAEGERHFAQALAILEKALGPDHPGLLVVLADLGYLRLATGDYAGAESLFARSLARREALYGPDSERLISGLGGLAQVLLKQGQAERSEQVTRRSIALQDRARQPSAPSQALLGTILLAQGRIAEAEAACGTARAAAEARGDSGRTQVASALLCLGEARLAAGDLAGASPLMAEAVRIREAAYGSDHPTLADALLARGRLLARQGQAKAARDAVARATRIRERRLGPTHPALAEAHTVLAALEK